MCLLAPRHLQPCTTHPASLVAHRLAAGHTTSCSLGTSNFHATFRRRCCSPGTQIELHLLARCCSPAPPAAPRPPRASSQAPAQQSCLSGPIAPPAGRTSAAPRQTPSTACCLACLAARAPLRRWARESGFSASSGQRKASARFSPPPPLAAAAAAAAAGAAGCGQFQLLRQRPQLGGADRDGQVRCRAPDPR